MTREETKQAIAVMQAYVDGAEVEYRGRSSSVWQEVSNTGPSWQHHDFTYRVKPEIEIELDRWYEISGGIVMQCKQIKHEGIIGKSGVIAPFNSILREVRVEAVE